MAGLELTLFLLESGNQHEWVAGWPMYLPSESPVVRTGADFSDFNLSF